MPSEIEGAVTPRWSAFAAAAIPVAAVVALDPAGWNPFGPAKWFAVSVLVAVAALAAVIDDDLRLPPAATVWWAALLGWLLVATLVAVDPRLAWLGTAERHLGWSTWLLFAVAFGVGCQLTRRVDVELMAAGVVVAAVAGGAYAWFELLIRRPVEIDVDTARLGGPFGSAAYLGAASVLVVPVCAAAVADVRLGRWWRIAAAVGAVLMSVALVGSGARAAWVGVAVAAVPVVVRLVASRRRGVVAGIVACVAVAVVVVAPRLGEVTDRSAPASSRIDEWRLAVRVIAESPVAGVGPEGYRIAVVGHIDADYERAYGRDVAPDRAHSGPLDVAAVGGVPAVVGYVGLLVVVGAAALGAIRRGRLVIAGMGAGVVAYGVQQLLLFPIAELDPVFWLLAGVVVAADGRRAWRVGGRSVRTAAASIAALGAVALFVGGLADVAADRAARQAIRSERPAVAIERARRAADLRPDAIRHHLLLAALHERQGTLAGTDAAIAATEDALRWSPDDPIVRRSHAAYLSRRAEITGVDDDVDRALAGWLDVVDTDPNCGRCLLALGFAAALGDDVELARSAWERASTLTDDPLVADLVAELDRVDR